MAADPGAWCPDQYNNPDNIDVYATLAEEMWRQLGPMPLARQPTWRSEAAEQRLVAVTLAGLQTEGFTVARRRLRRRPHRR
jgi:cysteine synthase